MLENTVGEEVRMEWNPSLLREVSVSCCWEEEKIGVGAKARKSRSKSKEENRQIG